MAHNTGLAATVCYGSVRQLQYQASKCPPSGEALLGPPGSGKQIAASVLDDILGLCGQLGDAIGRGKLDELRKV